MVDLDFVPETREPVIRDGVGYLLLTQSKVTYFDPEFLGLISSYKSWHLYEKRSTSYAVHSTGYYDDGRRLPKIKMHRIVTSASSDFVVDHKNGNGLDNRLKNLRVCTVQQNNMNKAPFANTTSKYKGVRLDRGKWRAQLSFDMKFHHIGYFNTEIEAAIAYDKKARELHGEYAWLNSNNFEELKNIESNP